MALPDIKIRFGVDSEPAVRGVKRVNQSLVRTQRAARNAAFQVSDLAAQISDDPSVMRAMGQQLPPWLGGLGSLWAAGCAAAALIAWLR